MCKDFRAGLSALQPFPEVPVIWFFRQQQPPTVSLVSMEDHTSSKEVTSTNVPPIPARNEGMPPAIPARNHSVPPPIPVQNQSVPPPIPVRAPKETAVPESSPRRRPIGAVATALISTEELGHKPSGSVDLARVDDAQQQQADDTSEEPLSRNPYDLKATAGSTVTASYPFHGDESVQQLSFAVSRSTIAVISHVG